MYVAGLCYDYCVGSCARDAAKFGFKTYVLTDLTKSIADESHKAMDAIMAEKGVNLVASTDV